MARFLNSNDIPMKKRRPHIERYRRQLRDALMNPGLSDDQRNKIKTRLNGLGQPKVYGVAGRVSTTTESHLALQAAEPVPAPVAPTTTPAVSASPSVETLDDLLVLTKAELLALAGNEEVEAFRSWNNVKIAEALLAKRSGQ